MLFPMLSSKHLNICDETNPYVETKRIMTESTWALGESG